MIGALARAALSVSKWSFVKEWARRVTMSREPELPLRNAFKRE
jgi:hypothetical protein